MLLDTRRHAVPIAPVSYAVAKRMLDIVGSLIALLLGFPLFFVLGILIKLTSPGPILFTQTRVGLGGERFTCFKFRSMYMDAEARLHQLRAHNEVSGPVFKIRHDPRITPLGRVLRKYSLDELPQFLNVLFGDMSLVGPRPPIPSEVEKYTLRQLGRLSVKPGLTCLWQISGRSDIDFERWVELDLQYVERMSFWEDLRILLMTVPAVITGRGAY